MGQILKIMSKLSKLVEYHLKTKHIVFKHIHKNEASDEEEITYIVNSITDQNTSYSIDCKNDLWSCDCSSFKYKTGVNTVGHCKHIQLVLFLIANKIEIEVI